MTYANDFDFDEMVDEDEYIDDEETLDEFLATNLSEDPLYDDEYEDEEYLDDLDDWGDDEDSIKEEWE